MAGNLYWYSWKTNTLFINSNAILPDTTGMTMKERVRANKAAFALSYEERIERYATEQQKLEIRKALEEHPNCNISEFINA